MWFREGFLFIWQNDCQKTADGPEPTVWFFGGCHWAQYGLVARSINFKRALTTSDAKWPHCVMVNLCVLFSKICIHESYTDGCPFDMTYIYEKPDILPIKTSNILHKHTRTYHYKRWVLSQARSFIDPCKMAESTLTVVAQWDCKVNINQRERWLIDPLLPNSPSLLRLIMPSFNAPPSLSLQSLWACSDLVTSLQIEPNWIKTHHRLQFTPDIRMHLSSAG